MNRYDRTIEQINWLFDESPWPIRSVLSLICTVIVWLLVIAGCAFMLSVISLAGGLFLFAVVIIICLGLLFTLHDKVVPKHTYQGKVISIERNKGRGSRFFPKIAIVRLADGRTLRWRVYSKGLATGSCVLYCRQGLANRLTKEDGSFEESFWGKMPVC